MNQKLKQNIALVNLIEQFELTYDLNILSFLSIEEFDQLIDYYVYKEDCDQAIEICRLALKQYKYRAKYYIKITKLYLKNGNLESSMFYLEKGQSIAPFDTSILLLKCQIYTSSKQYYKAFECLDNLKQFAKGKDMEKILLCESSIYQKMHLYYEMYSCLLDAIELNPRNEKLLNKFLVATNLSRNHFKSIDFLEKLLNEDPYNYLAWYNLGHAYLYDCNYENAIASFEYSFFLNSSFEMGYLECAEIYCQINEYYKALIIYQEAIDVFGEDSDILTLIARCQLECNLTAEAKQNLYKAVRLEPYCDEIYYILAECYASENKWYSAINAYHKAIEIDEGSEDYYLGLAKAYIAVEEYNKATVNFQLAVKVGPEQTKYWLEFTTFLIKLGLFEEAIKVLDEAEGFTYGADLLYTRGIISFLMKKKDEGMKYLRNALEEDPHCHSHLWPLAPELQLDPEIDEMINYYNLKN